MRYHPLGRTGLFVSELCLGTMTFGGGDGHLEPDRRPAAGRGRAPRRRARSTPASTSSTPPTSIPTAASEEITGQALKNLKVPRDERRRRHQGVRRDRRRARTRAARRAATSSTACKASLKRLQLDHIDLYQIHGFDPATPIEETVRALDTLVRQGHVRYVGVSNWAAWQIVKALGIAERLGLARFESLQAYYTIAGRDLERELVPMLQSEGVGLMVWSPLAGGLLSGKYGREQQAENGQPAHRRSTSRRSTRTAPTTCIDAMREIAEAHGVSVAQIALAWLLHQPAVTSVIIGAKRPEQLADNIGATAGRARAPTSWPRSTRSAACRPNIRAGCSTRQGEYRRKQMPKRGDDLTSWLGTGSKRITRGHPLHRHRLPVGELLPVRRAAEAGAVARSADAGEGPRAQLTRFSSPSRVNRSVVSSSSSVFRAIYLTQPCARCCGRTSFS